MPNIFNDITTFAFSERQNSWATRYSFAPTCYANCGDSMLSSKDNTTIWLHDVNEERNKFYDKPALGSAVEVSFNDLPSDVKVFNSVSVETNIKDISATFFSSDELKDQGIGGVQLFDGQTSIYSSFFFSDEKESFIDLEGIKYCPVPRNTPAGFHVQHSGDLSDSSTVYMGAISLDSFLLEPSFFEEQQDFYEFKVRLSKSVESSIPVGRYNPIDLNNFSRGPEVQIPTETNFKILAFDVGENEDVLVTNEDQYYGGPSGASSLRNSLCIVAQDGDVLTLRYQRHVSYYEDSAPPFVPFELFISNGDPINPEIAEPFSFVLNSGDPMFLSTPQTVNGEQIRSTYMRTFFYINSQGEYAEINAVNCDYDLSRNHHSLTQNS